MRAHNKQPRHGRSLRIRLFAAFVALLMPLQLAGYFIIRWNNDQLKDEIERRAASGVASLMETLESELEDIQSRLNLLVSGNDTTLRAFTVNSPRMPKNEYWMSLYRIVQWLKFSALNNALIDEIRVHYTELALTVSSTRGVMEADSSEIKAQLAQFYEQGAQLIDTGDTIFMGMLFPQTAYYPSYRDSGKSPVIFVQAVLSKEGIYQLLSTFEMDAPRETILINKNAGSVLAAPDNALPAAVLIEADILNLARGARTPLSIDIAGETYSVFSAESASLKLAIAQLIPMDTMTRVNDRVQSMLAIYLLLSVPLLFLYALITNRIVMKPVKRLVDAFHQVRNGRFSYRIEDDANTSEFSSAIRDFNDMTARLNELIDTVYEQQLLNRQMELKQLQAQINPHFLFNNLFILKHMIKEEDNDTAVLLADHLGEYFEYITRTGNGRVPLKSEYGHVETYMRIQSLRFGSRLAFEIDPLPESAAEMEVPKLILQPLLENALAHGVEARGRGTVKMRFIERCDSFMIEVEDDGEGMPEARVEALTRLLADDDKAAETTGLINIHRRLRLAFPSRAGLELARGEMGGLLVTITLPYRLEKEA